MHSSEETHTMVYGLQMGIRLHWIVEPIFSCGLLWQVGGAGVLQA